MKFHPNNPLEKCTRPPRLFDIDHEGCVKTYVDPWSRAQEISLIFTLAKVLCDDAEKVKFLKAWNV